MLRTPSGNGRDGEGVRDVLGEEGRRPVVLGPRGNRVLKDKVDG